jgi:hypothetical protein
MSKYLIAAGNDVIAANEQWDYCMKHDLPCVQVIPGEDDKFADVQFDVLPMLSFHKISNYPSDKVMIIYKSYAEFFRLPEDAFKYIGGSNNGIFTVFQEHAEFIAEKLFDYLGAFMRENRKEYV